MKLSEYIPFLLQHSQKSSNIWATFMTIAVGIIGLIYAKPDLVNTDTEKIFFSVGVTILSVYYFLLMRRIHIRKKESWIVVREINKSENEEFPNNEIRNSINRYIISLEPISLCWKAVGIIAIYIFLICFIWWIR